ncbi:MAG: hypothetical protein ACE5H9_12975 [Anaerolineae bacterium]
MGNQGSAVWKLNSGIFGAYVLVTMLVTYPAIAGLVIPYAIPGAGGDSRYFLWHLWWVKHALLDLGTSPTFTDSIFYPTGGVLFLVSPFNELAALTLQPLVGLTRTYTLLWLFSFPTAGFTTYLLGHHLTGNRWAAFVGGLIFAFSARHYAHGVSHLGLWTIQWLPLYALALFLLLKRPSLKTAVLTSASFILAVTSEHVYYVFYFVIPVTALFAAYYGFAARSRPQPVRFWTAFAGSILVGLILVSPIYLHIIPNRNQDFIQGRGDGVVAYSADVLAYLTPAEKHPVWHKIVAPAYERIGGNEEENTIFIGYAAITLMLVGLKAQRNRAARFWLLLGGLAFLFSLGPILHLYGPVKVTAEDIETYVALPYSLLVNLPLIDLLRAPARMAVTVQLAVAILATYGLKATARHWRGAWRLGAYTALGVFILFESLFQFPYRLDTTTLIPPPIYQEIAGEKNDLAVLEVPSRRKSRNLVPTKGIGRGSAFYLMYYATIHRHPLLGGESSRTPAAPALFLDTTAFVRELMHPTDPAEDRPDILATGNNELVKHGAELLARHKIGYVVLHRDLLAGEMDGSGQPAPEPVLRQALGEPFYDDGQVAGFRVPQGDAPAASTAEALIVGDGWYPRVELDGRPARWMRRTGTLLIYEPEPGLARLSITAFAPMANFARVTTTVNGVPLETFQIAPASDAPEPHLTRAFWLTPGANEIKFEVQPVGAPTEQLDPHVYLGAYDISLLPALAEQDVAPGVRRRINLADKVELLGYDPPAGPLQAGQALRLTLYWRALQPLDESYKVFVHMVDREGTLIAQRDSIPFNWMLPTTAWGDDEVIKDDYEVTIPPDIPPGSYQIRAGMYLLQTMQRLNVYEEGAPTSADSILLGDIDIK